MWKPSMVNLWVRVEGPYKTWSWGVRGLGRKIEEIKKKKIGVFFMKLFFIHGYPIYYINTIGNMELDNIGWASRTQGIWGRGLGAKRVEEMRLKEKKY